MNGIGSTNKDSSWITQTQNKPRPLADAKSVARNITLNLAKKREDIEHIKKISDTVVGQKTRFFVNEDSGDLVVAVIDPHTNTVIREIPSESEQHLHAELRRFATLTENRGGGLMIGGMLRLEA